MSIHTGLTDDRPGPEIGNIVGGPVVCLGVFIQFQQRVIDRRDFLTDGLIVVACVLQGNEDKSASVNQVVGGVENSASPEVLSLTVIRQLIVCRSGDNRTVKAINRIRVDNGPQTAGAENIGGDVVDLLGSCVP